MRLRELVLCLALLAACTGSPAAQPTPSPDALTPSTTAASEISKVLTVVLENHGPKAAYEQMPYLASLARAHGSTTGYRALTHPSLPNYIAMAGGSTMGVTDDGDPDEHPLQRRSVFDAALASGHTAGVFAEGMDAPCERSSHDAYAVRHNPWVYFASASSRAACEQHDVPSGEPDEGALHDAIASGSLPDVGMLVPDLCHDGHDCGLDKADARLRSWLEPVLAGPDYSSGRLAVVVTFDEDEGNGDVTSEVLTVVVAPGVTKRVVTQALDHRSWCRWMTDLVGAPPLGDAQTAVSLGEAFGV